MRSVLSCACEKLSDDNGIRIDCGDVGDLSCNLLVLGGYSAIGKLEEQYKKTLEELGKQNGLSILSI